MTNNEIINYALGMLCKRAEYFEKDFGAGGSYDAGAYHAYTSAIDIINYALEGNWDCLKEFDYYD